MFKGAKGRKRQLFVVMGIMLVAWLLLKLSAPWAQSLSDREKVIVFACIGIGAMFAIPLVLLLLTRDTDA